jgi:uroporphyrinogen-III decarboxylase
MNSIERVRAALHFTGPDKIPIWGFKSSDVYPLIMVPSENWQPGNLNEEKGLFPHAILDELIMGGLWNWKKPAWAKNNPNYEGLKWFNEEREEIDMWGCIWNRKGGEKTSMGHPGRPSLTNWSHMDKYLEKYAPDPYDKSQFSPFFLDPAKTYQKKKYKICCLGHLGPFGTGANMRGFSNFLIDHQKHPEEVKRLLSYLTEWNIKNIDAWIKYGADPQGFLLVEDLGEQNGPFMSPKMFKKFYEPVFRELCKASHDRNCEFHIHCCGKIDPIMPDLIEWGVDALELDSPRMTGYPNFKPFRGKIMFWGCVNIQSIYIRGTPDQCEREVWHMIRNLGTPEGGFGADFYSEPHLLKVPKENIKAFTRGIKKYGTYANIPVNWWEYPIEETWKDDEVPPLPPFEL